MNYARPTRLSWTLVAVSFACGAGCVAALALAALAASDVASLWGVAARSSEDQMLAVRTTAGLGMLLVVAASLGATSLFAFCFRRRPA